MRAQVAGAKSPYVDPTEQLVCEVVVRDIKRSVAFAEFPVANVRVMVPNVDDCWKVASDVGARVVVPIGDRYYGLRDFTIADPDGFGIRFASLVDRG